MADFELMNLPKNGLNQKLQHFSATLWEKHTYTHWVNTRYFQENYDKTAWERPKCSRNEAQIKTKIEPSLKVPFWKCQFQQAKMYSFQWQRNEKLRKYAMCQLSSQFQHSLAKSEVYWRKSENPHLEFKSKRPKKSDRVNFVFCIHE